jgi:hypothetical protein
MYVYIWKDPNGNPFYVGLTKNIRRTNPRNNGGRNWLTRQKLEEVGVHNVIIEIRPVTSIVLAQELERKLIEEYGRIQMGTGPLTNLREGGEVVAGPTEERRKQLREAMLRPDHPSRSPEARARQKSRMNDPDVRIKFVGENNPSKRPEIRAKLKAIWQDPLYREKQRISRTGVKRKLSEETKEKLRLKLLSNPLMKGWKKWKELASKDPELEAKRIKGIRDAQDRRREKMSDPEALAQRKARLKQTMNSEEYKAKMAANKAERSAKISEALKASWAKRKAAI